MFYDEVPGRGVATNSSVTNKATGIGDEVIPQDLRNSDTATLIGVAPERTSLEMRSDDQLMIAVAQGDCNALEMLYDRHVRQCFGLALRIMREPSLAEDVVQDIFTKLWSRPETYNPKRGNFKAWLLAVVRNRGLDTLRSLKSRPTMSMLPLQVERGGTDILVDMLPDTAPTPYEQAWAREVQGVVQYALRQLPVSEYQIITLAYFGGLSQREIANKLQQPLGTVKTRTRSALRRLHNLVGSQGALSD